MKKWNRTTMKWFFDNYQTNMPIPSQITGIGENFARTEKSLHIISQPDSRKCRVVFMIHWAETWRNIIEERLKKNFSDRTLWIKPPNPPSIFVLKLSLLKGEQFCDAGIKIAQAIFNALGIYDPTNSKIMNFSVEQETLVWHDGGWTPFKVYLCIRHKLIAPRAEAH